MCPIYVWYGKQHRRCRVAGRHAVETYSDVFTFLIVSELKISKQEKQTKIQSLHTPTVGFGRGWLVYVCYLFAVGVASPARLCKWNSRRLLFFPSEVIFVSFYLFIFLTLFTRWLICRWNDFLADEFLRLLEYSISGTDDSYERTWNREGISYDPMQFLRTTVQFSSS
jgi:hypothetical protein